MSTALGKDHVIRRAIATVCLSGTLDDKLDAVGAAGFDGVEIFENDLIASSSTPGRSTEALRRSRPVDRPLPTVPRLRLRDASTGSLRSCAGPNTSSR